MKNLILYSSLFFSTSLFAGGSWGGGTPPAISETIELSESGVGGNGGPPALAVGLQSKRDKSRASLHPR